MAKLPDLGPAFVIEWQAAARRWHVYAMRSLFVAGLLAGLLFAGWVERQQGQRAPLRGRARVGFLFFAAISGTQLGLVLLAAPAATAGAICLDRTRGALTHVLVTDLSSAEIILGKLAARLTPVLGLIALALPVAVVATLLGGVDPDALLMATLLAAGLAVLGCTLRLTFSVWATRTQEVLLATYTVWTLWLGAGPAWLLSSQLGVLATGPPEWLSKSNPLMMIFDLAMRPGKTGWLDVGRFCVGALSIAAMLTMAAIARLRPVTARQLDQPSRPRRARWPRWWPGPSLDRNPVLWREWHRHQPAGWIGRIWSLYYAMALGATALMVYIVASHGLGRSSQFVSPVNGFLVASGMVLLVITASTSLAEERTRGHLDVLLTTPLSSRAIVLGKWWSAFRAVPRLAVLPAVAATVLACRSGRFAGVALIVGMVFSYGAAMASLGLALATWVPNVGRAATLGVSAHVLITVGWFFTILMLTNGMTGFLGPGLALASPFIGVTFTTILMQLPGTGDWSYCIAWMSFWIVVELAAAALLLTATLATFDRCLGRTTDRSGGHGSRAERSPP